MTSAPSPASVSPQYSACSSASSMTRMPVSGPGRCVGVPGVERSCCAAMGCSFGLLSRTRLPRVLWRARESSAARDPELYRVRESGARGSAYCEMRSAGFSAAGSPGTLESWVASRPCGIGQVKSRVDTCQSVVCRRYFLLWVKPVDSRMQSRVTALAACGVRVYGVYRYIRDRARCRSANGSPVASTKDLLTCSVPSSACGRSTLPFV